MEFQDGVLLFGSINEIDWNLSGYLYPGTIEYSTIQVSTNLEIFKEEYRRNTTNPT